jgi:hypothetical protein
VRSDVHIVWDEQGLAAMEDDREVVALMDRLAAEAVLTMKRFANVSPVGPLHRSGNMRSSIHVWRTGDAYGRAWNIGPSADYARWVNSGSVPHVIRSHGDYPLRNRETGQVFGREVHHPGYAGSHFVERTASTLGGRVYHL